MLLLLPLKLQRKTIDRCVTNTVTRSRLSRYLRCNDAKAVFNDQKKKRLKPKMNDTDV